MTAAIRRVIYVFIVGVTLLTLYLMFDSITDRLSAAESERRQTDTALGQANAKVSALGDQVRGLGERPVVSTAPVSGPRVVQGAPGPQGPQGLTGRDGEPGADGVGTPGAAGTSGTDGEPGPSGSTGPKGDTGATGPAGADGKNGADGAPGAQGPTGAAGVDGRGVAEISCVALTPFTLTFTFTDGTTSDVSCGA